MFNDVVRATYEELQRIRLNSEPYRGKDMKFWPLGNRKYSSRHFSYDEDTGVYSLFYGALWRHDEEEIERRTKMSDLKLKPLMKVHPDNSAEFVSVVDISEGLIVSRLLLGSRYRDWGTYGTVSQIKSKGGMVLTVRNKDDKKQYPVFNGLRVSMDTIEVHPESKFSVLHPILDTKVVRPYMAQFDEFLKVYSLYLAQLDEKVAIDTLEDLTDRGVVTKDEKVTIRATYTLDRKLVPSIFESLVLQRDYLGALVVLQFRNRWGFNFGIQSWADQILLKSTKSYLSDKAAFTKFLVAGDKKFFKFKELPIGTLRSTKWSQHISVVSK
jgi:hypothetical protein